MLRFTRPTVPVAEEREEGWASSEDGAARPVGLEPARPTGEARSMATLFDRAVARFSSRPAIDFLGRRWSYGQLGDLVDRAARGLQDLGVGKGSMVGLCLPNTPYSVIFYFAVLKAG